MIENSVDNLTHACGIYVDGEFICAVKNEADAKTVFYDILEPYEADAELKKDNRPYILVDTGMTDSDGQPKMQVKANPNIKKRHDNALLCLKFFDQLGLSPLARAKAGLAGCNSKEML